MSQATDADYFGTRTQPGKYFRCKKKEHKNEHKIKAAMTGCLSYKDGGKIRRAENVRITSRLPGCATLSIIIVTARSKHRLKLMIIRYTVVCARSNRRETYVDAMQCICNVKHSCARRVLLTSQGTLAYISWMFQQYSAFSSLPSCSLSFHRVF